MRSAQRRGPAVSLLKFADSAASSAPIDASLEQPRARPNATIQTLSPATPRPTPRAASSTPIAASLEQSRAREAVSFNDVSRDPDGGQQAKTSPAPSKPMTIEAALSPSLDSMRSSRSLSHQPPLARRSELGGGASSNIPILRGAQRIARAEQAQMATATALPHVRDSSRPMARKRRERGEARAGPAAVFRYGEEHRPKHRRAQQA
jgi:hypothetical protein